MGKLRLTISTEEVKNPDKELLRLYKEKSEAEELFSSEDSPNKQRLFFITYAKILHGIRVAMNNKISARWE